MIGIVVRMDDDQLSSDIVLDQVKRKKKVKVMRVIKVDLMGSCFVGGQKEAKYIN